MTELDGLVVVATPGNVRFAPDDPRQRTAAVELAGELRRVVPLVPPPPDPGGKGAVETAAHITALLGSLSAVRYAVVAFRAWLERDAKRKVELKVRAGRSERVIQLRVDGFDEDAVIRMLGEALNDRAGD